jgi:hypothetical protein
LLPHRNDHDQPCRDPYHNRGTAQGTSGTVMSHCIRGCGACIIRERFAKGARYCRGDPSANCGFRASSVAARINSIHGMSYRKRLHDETPV